MSEVFTQKSPLKSRTPMVALGISVVFLAALVLLISHWPFRRHAVLKVLEEESLSRVSIGKFHETYFPRPGCVLENVVFQHNSMAKTPPLITVEKIRIEGSFAGLFTRHVKRILAEGLHIFVPPRGTGEHFETPQRSSIVIDDLVADGAVLDVASRQSGKQPLRFVFQEFTLHRIGGDGPAFFKARLSNPEPPGEITTTGNFGPWNADHVGQTAVSGRYSFERADLGAFQGINGLLSSSGKYDGTLEHLKVEGTTDVPLFAVMSSPHQVQLRTQFHALVNTEDGDTFLQDVKANFSHTTVSTQGSVAGKPDVPGKTASLEIASEHGQIQDLLLLFANSPRAPMSGAVSFKARVSIPPGRRPFLEKVELQADFGIDAGTFTKPDTQQEINTLSQGARGEKTHKSKDDDIDPATVLSDLKGHVRLENGTARFSDLSFTVPGALAHMQGTYNLISEKIDLHGTLRTDADISKTTHGIKALMLKLLDPFLKNKPSGYVAPVKITGTYDHPSFGLDLEGPKNDQKRNTKVYPSKLPDRAND